MAISSISELNNVAGSNTEIQYNNNGVFGASSNLTFNGTDELQLTDNTKLTLGTGNDADIYYDGTNLVLEPQVVGSGAVVINDAANVFLNETANANSTVGLTINQGATDNTILAFKSSDVAHGVTNVQETDTFGWFSKQTHSAGGLYIGGASEAQFGIYGAGFATTENSTRGTTGTGNIFFVASKANGTSNTYHGSNVNIFGVGSKDQARFLIDQEGDVHYDGTTNAGAWDDHDDLGLLNTVRNLTTGNKAQDIFGAFVSENAQILHDTGVITMNDDGHHFVSTKGLNALIIDTIRQEGQKWRTAMDQRDNEIAELRGELMRLQERNN